MEVRSTCGDTDILCIAEELADKWERRQAAASPAQRPIDPDCLPCIVADWDGEFGC